MTKPAPIKFVRSLTWPSAKETAVLSVITVIVSAVACAVIWAADLGLTAGVSLM